MRVPPVLSALLLAGLLTAQPAFAWGPEGHEVVAHIAARNLTARARAAVASLLGGEAEAMMTLDANWADEIRDKRPETAPWHYVDIADDAHYVPARDCRNGDCVVAQIARDETILKSPAPAAQKTEALRFLIHFAGDIRQPLHASDRARGGNDVTLGYHGQRTNLHRVWDSEVVSALGRDPIRLAQEIDWQFSAGQKAQLGSGTPQDWAQDSERLARDAIWSTLPPMPRGLPERYAADNAGLVRLQLAKAGFSLATMLNAIFR